MSPEELVDQLTDAYEHLYDFVYLRTHPLVDMVVPCPDSRRKERAWQLHRTLLDVIDELDPGPKAAVFSREWRRHRLMVLRYSQGLDPQSVADELGISRRHYYRETKAPIEAIASILWGRHVARQSTTQRAEVRPPANHLELLRLEASRAARANPYSNLHEVVHASVSLLQEMLPEHTLRLRVKVDEALPHVQIDEGLLRQLIFGLLGYLMEVGDQASVRVSAIRSAAGIPLSATSATIRPSRFPGKSIKS